MLKLCLNNRVACRIAGALITVSSLVWPMAAEAKEITVAGAYRESDELLYKLSNFDIRDLRIRPEALPDTQPVFADPYNSKLFGKLAKAYRQFDFETLEKLAASENGPAWGDKDKAVNAHKAIAEKAIRIMFRILLADAAGDLSAATRQFQTLWKYAPGFPLDHPAAKAILAPAWISQWRTLTKERGSTEKNQMLIWKNGYPITIPSDAELIAGMITIRIPPDRMVSAFVFEKTAWAEVRLALELFMVAQQPLTEENAAVLKRNKNTRLFLANRNGTCRMIYGGDDVQGLCSGPASLWFPEPRTVSPAISIAELTPDAVDLVNKRPLDTKSAKKSNSPRKGKIRKSVFWTTGAILGAAGLSTLVLLAGGKPDVQVSW